MPSGPDLPTLYHARLSFYSQIIRLILAEKQVEYREKIVFPGPPDFGSYHPDYMRLNPNGTVPTLVVKDRVFTDSYQLIFKINKLFDGPDLNGTNTITTGTWIVRVYALAQRELAFGQGVARAAGEKVNQRRIELLQSYAQQYPDLAAAYRAKLADIESFNETLQHRSHIETIRQNFHRAMSILNKVLGNLPYVAGKEYTVADCAWTAVVARMKILDNDPCPGLPCLAEWFERMRNRPSYRQAKIVDTLHDSQKAKLLRTLWH